MTLINSRSSLDRPYIRNVPSYDNKASHSISATEDMTKHRFFQLFSSPTDRKLEPKAVRKYFPRGRASLLTARKVHR